MFGCLLCVGAFLSTLSELQYVETNKLYATLPVTYWGLLEKHNLVISTFYQISTFPPPEIKLIFDFKLYRLISHKYICILNLS